MRSKLSSIGASLVLAIAAGDAWAVTGNVTPRSLSPLVTQGPTERLYAVTELQEALAKSAPYQAFLTRHGRGWEAQWDEILGTPVWVRGEGIPLIPAYRSASREQVEEVSRAFLRENRELFKVDPSDLALDSCTFYADTWVVYFHHEHRGLPVIRSSVELVFKLGRLVLFYGESYPVGDAEVAPLLTSDQARDVASGELGLPTSDTKSMPRDRSRLVIYPAITRAAIEYHLAWEITQERLDATPELSFLSYVDARTGKILEIQDRIENQFSGNVKAKVDDRTVGSPIVSANDTEERVIVGGSQTYTDVSGNWTVGGSGTQTLTLSLVGRHTSIANQAGGNLTISHPVTAGTPSNDVFNAGTEFELAQTDTYRAINATNLMVQGVYTGNAWLTSTVVTAKVNVNQTCNAYWDGANINMFRAGGQCNNTGRIFDVVAHEYGHGCDQNLPGGIADGGLSEFIGDQMAFLQTDDDRIGPGFFTAGGPIRDIDPSNFPCYDPNETEVHNQGEMLGSVVWDIHEALEAAGVTGTPLKNLLLTPIATSQTRSSWYNGMLVADDDDGNLNNGTPHGCIIWGQFNAHSCGQTRWPGVPTTQVPCTGGGGNPTADFMGNPTSGSSPLNVQFTDLSSGSPTQWAWDFGDGQGSYAQNPAHTYTTGGSFDVGLTIVNATGSAFKVKSKYINVNGGSGGDADIITGPGPGAIGPIVRTWDHEAPPAAVNSWAAYNAPYYGANVASVDIIGGGTREIITGPGPGAGYGPLVRAWQPNGIGIAKVNFFAYGANAGGVHVSGGDVDLDGHEELLTAPGPVGSFPPQVRGWNYDGANVSAIQKINFYAYNGVGWGGRVGAGDIDGDGYAEILTGPGPGAAYPTNVRSFNYDGNQVAWWHNFYAFYNGTFGASVAGGDTDGDGADEIVVTHGPDPYSAQNARGFNAAPLVLDWQFTAFGGGGGAEVAVGDLISGGADEVLMGQGWGLPNPAEVRGFRIVGGGASPIAGLDFLAYWNNPYGVKVAVGDLGI